MADTDVLKMKVADLKRELKMRGLPVIGNKTELQERLQTALLDGDSFSLDDAGISEDILDEDVLTDEEVEKAVLESSINVKSLLSSNSNIDTKAKNLLDQKESEDLNTEKPKKIVILKRKASTNTIGTNLSQLSKISDEQKILETEKKPEDVNGKMRKIEFHDDKSIDTNDDDKKKITVLTMQERLEFRAKKFGVSSSATGDSLTGKNNTKVDMGDPKVIEALKKRAERFGCAVSPQIVAIEKNEKLQKRKERFGVITGGNSDSDFNSNSIYAEKAKMRLERFKAQTTK